MIGRDRELGRLNDALETLPGGRRDRRRAGDRQVAAAARAARRARAAGCSCSGRAAEFERELPYGALVDALDAHLRTLDGPRLRGLDTQQLGGIFPALAELPPRRRCSRSSATARTAP